MGMLRGDELVADYLARVGRAAARVLPPAECSEVVEDISRRVRERVGPPGRQDAEGTARRLAELGEPEALVAAAGRDSMPFPVHTEDETNDTIDLGRIPPARTVAPAPSRVEVRVAGEDGRRRFGRRDSFVAGGPLRVRPSRPDEDRGPDPFAGWGRLGWEVAALALFVLGIFAFGLLPWLAAAVLVVRSSFWDVKDKVRVLFGVPVTAGVLAVLWAWINATQLQESNDSGTRVAHARDSLAESAAVMPELFSVIAAVYLAYALVRDHHTG